MKNNMISRLITVAFLIALEIILTRFLSINLPILRIGFGFLPVAVCAMLYGPLWAGAGYAIGDILGMLIWPSGAYFPGFTLSALLIGMTYGVILYKKNITRKRIIFAACVVLILFTIGLNTLWLAILYGNAFAGLLPTRIAEAAVMIPIQTVLIKIVHDQVIMRTPLARIISENKASDSQA